MRLTHSGTFDVADYGDSHFPLVARASVRSIFYTFASVCPIGGQMYDDVAASVAFRDVVAEGLHFDAASLGGGNIIAAGPSALKEYANTCRTAYLDLGAGAAQKRLGHSWAAANDALHGPGAADPLCVALIVLDAALGAIDDHWGRVQAMTGTSVGRDSLLLTRVPNLGKAVAAGNWVDTELLLKALQRVPR